MKELKFRFLISLSLLFFYSSASAVTLTSEWIGVDITATFPDKVTYNTPFNLNFLLDGSTLTQSDAVAFLTSVQVSDTIDYSTAAWEYLFISDDPAWNGTKKTGPLVPGDNVVEGPGSSFLINLTDPLTPPYTWLWDVWNDQVSWTLTDLIIKGDTNLALTLDDRLIVSQGMFSADIQVLDPPAGIPVPEPPVPLLLFICLLVFLAVRRRKTIRVL